MDKKALKLDLVQKLLLTEDDAVLSEVRKLLEDESVELSSAQKKELDARKQRHVSGKSRSYTWNEVKMMARQALRK